MIGIKSSITLLFRKLITSKTPVLTIRNLCPGKVLNDITDGHGEASQKDRIQTSKKPSTDLVEIYDYFKDSDAAHQVNKLPTRIQKQRKTKASYLYLFKNSVAENIIDLIKDDLLADPQKVIEVNAGTGMMTEKLLNAGIPLVRVMESNDKFIIALADLQERYLDRIIIYAADILNIWRLIYQDRQDDGNRVGSLFADLPLFKWGEEVGLKIIGALPNIDFIRNLILDVVRQSGLVSYGRPCLYLSIPPSIWLRLTCDNTAGISEYRGISVLFQLFFDYELLAEVPRKAFLPWPPNYNEKELSKRRRKPQMDTSHMYFARIEGKKNLFTDIIDEKDIQPLWHFVNHHMVARTGRVIPHMETWQPGCGPRLIMQDFNIFTQFGDLNPQEILKLFQQFTTWDGYQHFVESLENSPEKIEQLIF